MSRPLTELEAREMLLKHLAALSLFWSAQHGLTDLERCNNLVLSILQTIDGVAQDFPAIDLVLQPAPTEKHEAAAQGRNYFEEAQIINDDKTLLYELWPRYEAEPVYPVASEVGRR